MTPSRIAGISMLKMSTRRVGVGQRGRMLRPETTDLICAAVPSATTAGELGDPPPRQVADARPVIPLGQAGQPGRGLAVVGAGPGLGGESVGHAGNRGGAASARTGVGVTPGP